MNDIKKALRNLLTENARYTVPELALMTGASEEETQKSITEMENDGVIVKYTAIVDSAKLTEETVEALIEIKVVPQRMKGFDSIAEDISNFDEVKSLYLMSGGFDLAVFVKGSSITELSKTVSEKLAVIDGLVSVQTHFILKKYKIEGQITKKSDGEDRRIILA